MFRLLIILVIISINPLISAIAQTPFNITITNPVVEQILKGNYNPQIYLPTEIKNNPAQIACALHEEILPDSLNSYLLKLSSFHNRNTYADTVSNTTGIGAARRWAYNMFGRFSIENENRLLPAYMQFEMDNSALCGSGVFRNVLAILPGTDTTDKLIMIIEAHLDSRCEDACDITCQAHGADDNGSGSVLVLELSRVLSRFAFPRTIVFMLTVGEEQGLFGATAFAKYAQDNGISIRVVQNNDIVGGIECGETSSLPSCPAVAHLDSTQVRLFSFGTNNSAHKSYARFIKLTYREWLLPEARVPMMVSIMQPEDRTGRGGDHIPFRQRGFTAVRFSSANEHGHGNPSTPGYADRQHTSNDILGVDTNSDGVLDSFFVNFNYLARNIAINGMAASIAALGPQQPEIAVNLIDNKMVVFITDHGQHLHYRIGVRTTSHDFDVIFSFKDSAHYDLPGLIPGVAYRVSAATVNEQGVMSLFSNEIAFTSFVNTTDIAGDTLLFPETVCTNTSIDDEYTLLFSKKGVTVLSTFPNPFSHAVCFNLTLDDALLHRAASLMIYDVYGKKIESLPVNTDRNYTSVHYHNAAIPPGIYFFIFTVEGVPYASGRMIAAGN